MGVRSLARKVLIDAAVGLGCDVRSRRRQLETMRARGGCEALVLVLHGTPLRHADELRRHIAWLADQFTLVDFSVFKRLWDDPQPPQDGQPVALLTFDDGLASQFEVAAPLLEEFGTRGIFFVSPDFCRLEGDAARRFYETILRGPADYPWQPMTPQQVRELSDRGHTIGGHTLSHVRLSETSLDEAERQIRVAADDIEHWTGRAVESFAWTYSHDAITPAAHKLICQHHAWCFTPCPGLVDPAVDSPGLVWRTNVEACFRRSEWRFLCGGLGARLWRSRREQLRRTLGA